MHGPEGGVLSVSADSWQRLFRNRVGCPEDGALLEALLISWKDILGTACAVQKMGILSLSATFWKRLTRAACAVLGATIASHVTTYARHPVMFRSSYNIDFFRTPSAITR